MRRAVIDVGSNSVLTLIEERTEGAWVPLYESSAVTALGTGVKQTGLLAAKPMEDTLSALNAAFDVCKKLETSAIKARVTMAGRISTNVKDFLGRATEQGTPVEVLSGDDEAHLGFLSVANDPRFAKHQRVSIVDVGGHSTEVVTATRSDGSTSDWTVLYQRSFPIGTLGLRGSIMSSERAGMKEQLSACQAIDDVIGLCYLPNMSGCVVALGASATNLVTVRDRITTWDPEKVHGAFLDYEEVSKAAGWMCDMTDIMRSHIVGLEVGREQTIHIGALILERFLFTLRTLGCFASVRGWRHALLESDELW